MPRFRKEAELGCVAKYLLTVTETSSCVYKHALALGPAHSSCGAAPIPSSSTQDHFVTYTQRPK